MQLRWRVIIPVKPQQLSKTRLRDATGSISHHHELVRAIQLDTITAVLAAGSLLAGVHIVGEFSALPAGVHQHRDPQRGLNAALASVAASVALRWPNEGVIALMADLPALRPAELAEVLHNAAQVDRGLVIDAAGTGTTMLTAAPGCELKPSFGVNSAALHLAGGATALDAADGARSDVDTAEDLRRCIQLGVGEHTARMLTYLI
jgi:2-phospho-L-lactate guanylyltransferase